MSLLFQEDDNDNEEVDYEADMHGEELDDTAPRQSVLINQNDNHRLQQHHQNQAAAYAKSALAEPMRAGVLQHPYNYPAAIHPNYVNPNLVNNNGQYFIQQQPQQKLQPRQQLQQRPPQYYNRRGL